MEELYSIELTLEEWYIVVAGLKKIPYEKSSPIFKKVQSQIMTEQGNREIVTKK